MRWVIYRVYLNKIESVTLRKCSHDHGLNNEAYLSAITVTKHFVRVLPTRWRQESTGIDMEENYASVTYVKDAAYCYRCNVVRLSLCLSVGYDRACTVPAKRLNRSKCCLWVWTQVNPTNHVLDEGRTWKKALWGRTSAWPDLPAVDIVNLIH